MGESLGISAERGHQRARELGNVCLWCDEFFARHFDMETLQPRTEPAARKKVLPVLNPTAARLRTGDPLSEK